MEQHLAGRQSLPGPEHPAGRIIQSATLVRSGPGSGRSEPAMPDLLDSADPGSGNRPLVVSSPRTTTGVTPVPPIPPRFQTGGTGVPPVLLCQRVSKWYGPVIGVNQVTLELRSGITGL